MVKARKEKKVKLVWEELKNGGPFRKLYLVGAECLPVSRWLNVSELKKSFEKETFQKVAYKIWSSEKWLCVDGHYRV